MLLCMDITNIEIFSHKKESTEKMMSKLRRHNKACNLKLPDTESTDQCEHDEYGGKKKSSLLISMSNKQAGLQKLIPQQLD